MLGTHCSVIYSVTNLTPFHQNSKNDLKRKLNTSECLMLNVNKVVVVLPHACTINDQSGYPVKLCI